MISLRNVTKWYSSGSNRTFVLRDVNLDVQKGEFISVMGPSGAGKSTLLYIIGMLDIACEGSFRFLDQDVHLLNERRRAGLYKEHIGFVFQSYHLIDDLTVYENLETPLLYKKFSASQRKSLVCDMLDRFKMAAKKDLFPNQLSGGQQQLVGVARAIISSPKLLLADEPTGNLHSAQGEEIMQLLTQLNREGMTIIQVTHSDKNATYGQRIVHLEDGWIKN